MLSLAGEETCHSLTRRAETRDQVSAGNEVVSGDTEMPMHVRVASRIRDTNELSAVKHEAGMAVRSANCSVVRCVLSFPGFQREML